MFLNLLKPLEKTAFLALAKKVIAADKIVAEKEIILLQSMKNEMELQENLSLDETEESVEEICAKFTSGKSRVSALMELIGIGYVDGKFVYEEQSLIFDIARYMEIREEETKMYIEWAARVYAK